MDVMRRCIRRQRDLAAVERVERELLSRSTEAERRAMAVLKGLEAL
jgi:hypothetical protein